MNQYQLDDPKDLERFNRKLKAIGLTIQEGMCGSFMAYLDEALLTKITTRHAGRHSVITPQITMTVLQYHSEGLSFKEISSKTNVSKGTIGKILKAHQTKENIPEGQLSLNDL